MVVRMAMQSMLTCYMMIKRMVTWCEKSDYVKSNFAVALTLRQKIVADPSSMFKFHKMPTLSGPRSELVLE